jgi:hypothetical protein
MRIREQLENSDIGARLIGTCARSLGARLIVPCPMVASSAGPFHRHKGIH